MVLRILVVDDDAAVCATLEHLLRRVGNDVRAAISVSNAFQLAQAEPFDFLLCDLVMPQEDGVAVIRKFRALFPSLPIVAMSGGARLGTDESLASARAAGADELLRKPFTMESLMAAVEGAGRRRDRSAQQASG